MPSPTSVLVFSVVMAASPWLLGPISGRTPTDFRGVGPFLWWINRLYAALFHGLDLDDDDDDPLPGEGPALLASNHTCGVDHILLQAKTRRALGFMIAQELYDWRLVRPFYDVVRCIPVKRDGRDLSAMRASLRVLREGRVLPIFPEGHIVPHSGRVVEPGKAGTAYLALRSGVPVIPAHIGGTPETSDILKAMRTPSKSRVRFGPPVPLDDLRRPGLDERKAAAEATRRIMAAIRRLGGLPPEDPRPKTAHAAEGEGREASADLGAVSIEG